MLLNLLILAISIFMVIKGALLSTKYAVRLAKKMNFSSYLVGFIVIAIISILPETFISLNASLAGMPAFGLGTLFGSNVSDLTLVFFIIVILSGRSIKVESKILKNNLIYPYLFLIPIVLGLDGYYSRLEGCTLMVVGVLFYYFAFKNNIKKDLRPKQPKKNQDHTILMLVFSLAMLLIGAHFTVTAAAGLAHNLGINPILIGMLIVGIGTTIPEMLFSLTSVKKNHDAMAVGDILGTVLADGTVVVGLLALVNPFIFPKKIIYSTAIFMLMASFILSYFMRTGKRLSRKEAFILFAFWLLFVITEYFINQ